jgi:hypothetical protein
MVVEIVPVFVQAHYHHITYSPVFEDEGMVGSVHLFFPFKAGLRRRRPFFTGW